MPNYSLYKNLKFCCSSISNCFIYDVSCSCEVCDDGYYKILN